MQRKSAIAPVLWCYEAGELNGHSTHTVAPARSRPPRLIVLHRHGSCGYKGRTLNIVGTGLIEDRLLPGGMTGRFSRSALRRVRTSSARLRQNHWTGSSNEPGHHAKGQGGDHQTTMEELATYMRSWRGYFDFAKRRAPSAFASLRARCVSGARRHLLGAGRSHSLGSVATTGRSLAPILGFGSSNTPYFKVCEKIITKPT
jgi:hypothetical protein